MRKITLDKSLGLEIDGRVQVLKFSLGTMKSLGIERLDEAFERLSGTQTVFSAALFMLNGAIRKYNKDYNGKEKPITYTELTAVLTGLEYIRCLENGIKALYFLSLPRQKEISEEWQDDDPEEQKIEPTTGRLIVMGLTVLNLSYDEVSSMTAAEVCAMLDDYGYLNKTDRKKGGIHKHGTQGVGDAGALLP